METAVILDWIRNEPGWSQAIQTYNVHSAHVKEAIVKFVFMPAKRRADEAAAKRKAESDQRLAVVT